MPSPTGTPLPSAAHRSRCLTRPSAAIGPGTLLAGNLFRAAGLFFVRGDRIPRHNIPHRPLYDPLAGAFFLVGVLLSLGRVWSEKRTTQVGDQSIREQGFGGEGSGAYALALIWTGVMLIPTILAEDCPHFLRAVGVLPVAALFPALGLEWARKRLDALRRVPSWAGKVMVALVLGISATWGLYDYFWRHARNPELRYAFEADQVQEADRDQSLPGHGMAGRGRGRAARARRSPAGACT